MFVPTYSPQDKDYWRAGRGNRVGILRDHSPPLMAQALHTIPIAQRPPHGGWFQAILFGIFFDVGCLSINLTQFFLLPLRFLPLSWARELYERGINYTKGCFGILCVLVTQLFAPTSFVITYEGSEPVDSVFERNAEGQIVRIYLPEKLVIMANHQVYADWLYLWCLTYYMRSHDQVTIILKKSLKHIPFIGWGMQFYRFLFLERSWSADRIYLGKHLVSIAKRAQSAGQPFALIIFPEGTIDSKDTRPVSKKYADKLGIADMVHTLLPRSTGLLFALRTLAPAIPSLQVLDVTVGYPGTPANAYGHDYYTLRSIFFQGVPPPKIHIHLRLYPVSSIPIGKVSGKDSVGRGAEASPEEGAKFELWLRERWIEKDRLMHEFYRDGKFDPPTAAAAPVELPVRLISSWEALDAYAWFAPVPAGYLWRFAIRWIIGKFASGT